ncbi:MAG: bifunctional folylpolyglutamate synthase/dihydrofolate synthase [Rikenellaceae bacterium]|jgi:dihydrofolate synthase/folylpolyglutamate synthase|nr:bifunctional folylpolyglutamate synthase/dihydrofolate synthase [Rikenellaceae bacterium]
MTYGQTLEYLYGSLPEFQHVGAQAYKPGLERVAAFCERLGRPERSFASIHVAGTNGKGSTSHILASVLQAAGYRVGLYTSPHLVDFRERIRVDGQPVSEEEVVGFVGRWRGAMEGLSFFEMTVGMAFDHFRRSGVDVAVVETGLGGRLDATNIITPILSVITNIGLDHTALLGDTLPMIAAEKAGIIKPGVTAVVGESSPEYDGVFVRRARECGSELLFADALWQCVAAEPSAEGQVMELVRCGERHGGLPSGGENSSFHDEFSPFRVALDLTGGYQRKNMVACMAALDAMPLRIGRGAILAGCASAARSTGFSGRWQKLCDHPLTICDTGHNAHGLKEVTAQIARQGYERLYMVVGFVADKNLSEIVPLLPREAHYIFTQPSTPRALPASELAGLCRAAGLHGEASASVAGAYSAARSLASPSDMIFIGGSTFVVADLLAELRH